MPSLRRFSFLFGSNKEDVISRVRDPRAPPRTGPRRDPEGSARHERLSPQKIDRLLDSPDIVHAVGEDLIAAHRAASAGF